MDLVVLWHESYWIRDQSCVPCIGRQILYHGTTREVQGYFYNNCTRKFIKWLGCNETVLLVLLFTVLSWILLSLSQSQNYSDPIFLLLKIIPLLLSLLFLPHSRFLPPFFSLFLKCIGNILSKSLYLNILLLLPNRIDFLTAHKNRGSKFFYLRTLYL